MGSTCQALCWFPYRPLCLSSQQSCTEGATAPILQKNETWLKGLHSPVLFTPLTGDKAGIGVLLAENPSTEQHSRILPPTPKQPPENVIVIVFCASTTIRATGRNPQDSFQTDNWISPAHQSNNAMANSQTISNF